MDLLLLAWIVIPTTSIWVLVDALSLKVRKGKITGFFDMGPVGWFLCCLLLWVIAFPAYLVKRNEYRGLRRTLNGVEQIAQLAQLRDAGTITEKEFEDKKRELLARI